MARTERTFQRRSIAAFALLAFMAAAQGFAHAQGNDQRARVEGAFLVNFIRFTAWPPGRFADPRAPFVLTVVGSDEMAKGVRQVAAAAGPVQGRRIVVQQVDGEDLSRSRSLLRGSHVVFVDRTGGVPARQVVDLVAGASVLTVGDSEGFVRAGGMLGLVATGARVGFVANPAAIRHGGLAVSAKVLKLAQDTGP